MASPNINNQADNTQVNNNPQNPTTNQNLTTQHTGNYTMADIMGTQKMHDTEEVDQ